MKSSEGKDLRKTAARKRRSAVGNRGALFSISCRPTLNCLDLATNGLRRRFRPPIIGDYLPETQFGCCPLPYFLATKIEAFDHRGAGDFLLSRDVEDVIAILDGRLEIVEDVKYSEKDLLNYLAEQLSQWLSNPDFMDALPGLLPPDAASQARASKIIERIEMILGK